MANEADLFTRSRLLKSLVLMFVPFHLIGLLLPFNVLWATLAWIVSAPLAVGLSDAMGERSVNFFYGLGQRRLTTRHRLVGELDKIRYSERQKDFDKALSQVNDVLAKESEFPEALFLKAQILCEGFGNAAAAKSLLEKVMQLVSGKEPLHQWALSYSSNIHRPSKVTVISLLYTDGEPYLYFWHRAGNQLGYRTIYTASRIQIGELLKRVRLELATGDEIEVVTMNNPHGHGTLLLDFRRLDQSGRRRRLKVSIWPSDERRLQYFDKILGFESHPKR